MTKLLVVKFRKSLDSLAGKLILAVGVLMTVGSTIFGYIFITYEQQVTRQNLANHARFSAGLVEQGIHHGMLTARSAYIQETLEALGKAKDVRDIELYNPRGIVVHASDRAAIGRAAPEDPEIRSALRGRSAPPEIKTDSEGSHYMALYTPVLNEPSCYTARCHFHGRNQKVLGVLKTTFSATAIQTASRQIVVGTLLVGSVFIASISMFLCIILYHFVSKPVAQLEAGMKRLSKGDFSEPIRIHTKDEMGLLATTFNSMAYDMKRYREKLENWAQELQKEVDRKTDEIRAAHEQLIDAEKLASLGRLAAGVAHELNNPLTGIVTFAYLMKQRTPAERTQDVEDLDVIIEQAERCTKIIRGLLGFSRKGTSEKMAINVNDLMEHTISMLTNQSKFYNVAVDMHLAPDLKPVVVDPNQIQQVILNIFTNAADAMNDRGRIAIETRAVREGGQQYVEMSFTDTGPGILPEHMNRIFEPFFTTKPVGKGTGLGMPVSYGIVKRHGGDILVRSTVGKGSTFVVRLPVEVPEEARAGEKA
jgi:two-component system NtrC family sensor kinase